MSEANTYSVRMDLLAILFVPGFIISTVFCTTYCLKRTPVKSERYADDMGDLDRLHVPALPIPPLPTSQPGELYYSIVQTAYEIVPDNTNIPPQPQDYEHLEVKIKNPSNPYEGLSAKVKTKVKRNSVIQDNSTIPSTHVKKVNNRKSLTSKLKHSMTKTKSKISSNKDHLTIHTTNTKSQLSRSFKNSDKSASLKLSNSNKDINPKNVNMDSDKVKPPPPVNLQYRKDNRDKSPPKTIPPKSINAKGKVAIPPEGRKPQPAMKDPNLVTSDIIHVRVDHQLPQSLINREQYEKEVMRKLKVAKMNAGKLNKPDHQQDINYLS